MSNTGATDAQIEAGAWSSIGDYPAPETVIAMARNAAEMWAKHLVPPDQRIVPATVVPTDVELGAMRLMAMLPEGRTPAVRYAREVVRAYLERQS